MGSGEFDRLEPLSSTSPPSSTSMPHPAPPTFAHFSSLYDEAAFSVNYSPDRNANADQQQTMTSLDHKGMSRQSNPAHNAIRSVHPPHMSRDQNGVAALSLNSRQVISPSDIDYQLFSPTGSTSSRENTLPYQYQHHSSYSSRSSSSYPFDSTSTSSVSHTSAGVGVDVDAPIRGSGRKDRNRPERGSGRSHTPQLTRSDLEAIMVSNNPPDLVMNGYATIPRGSPRGSSHQREGSASVATPTGMEAASLENLRLSDSESNMAFRRDNPGRISITKKSKTYPNASENLRIKDMQPLCLL